MTYIYQLTIRCTKFNSIQFKKECQWVKGIELTIERSEFDSSVNFQYGEQL